MKKKTIRPRVWRGTGWVYSCFTANQPHRAPLICDQQSPAFNTRVSIAMTEIVKPKPRKGK